MYSKQKNLDIPLSNGSYISPEELRSAFGKLYFKRRNGEYYTNFTKEELYNSINCNNEASYLPLLEELDFPYFPDIWENTKHIGKYLSKMKLMSFKNFTWKDSPWLQEKVKG